MKTPKEILEGLRALADEIEQGIENPDYPEIGQDNWCIDEELRTYRCRWDNDTIDKRRWAMNNVFSCKEHAQERVEAIDKMIELGGRVDCYEEGRFVVRHQINGMSAPHRQGHIGKALNQWSYPSKEAANKAAPYEKIVMKNSWRV